MSSLHGAFHAATFFNEKRFPWQRLSLFYWYMLDLFILEFKAVNFWWVI
jgi:hypothetical protein